VLRFVPTSVGAVALCVFAVLPFSARASPGGPIPPSPPGIHKVGCSNIAQDFTRVPPGKSAQDWWEGYPDGDTPRYLTDLLAEPANSLVVNLPLPRDFTLYGFFGGRTYAHVVLVCYPTTSGNDRPDYVLPGGQSVPHMQRDNEAPIFADHALRYPVLLFSHGFGGSPISDDYIEAVKLFASHGYVVVAPFHGDSRFTTVNVESFRDALYALLYYKSYVAMQAVRPLALSAALDLVLAHPHFRDRVDPTRIGGFGASQGGESLLLMAGAAVTTSLPSETGKVTFDPRLKAGVGYIPYFGVQGYPAFGTDQKGLSGVTLPYLALSGTADTTAPITVTEQGVARLTGTRQLVALNGVRHEFDPRFSDDIFSWSLAFLAGQLSGDPVARAASARMTSVAGGGDDVLRIDYLAPTPERADESVAIEYFNRILEHFFVTAEPAEATMLDAGAIVPGWQRTGFAFKVRPAGDARGASTCRFFGTPGVGPNSHFFTLDVAECAKVKGNPSWMYEGLAFNTEVPAGDDCAADRVPVTRLYNNGKGGQANHRYTTSHSEMREMLADGWILEGTVFCAIP